MAEYVTLLGAEDVCRASSQMSSAASDMQRAADSIAYSLEMHQRFLDDWLMRLQATITDAGRAALSPDTQEAKHGRE